MIDCLHGRASSKIHGALEGPVLLFGGLEIHSHPHVPLTSHHPSPGNALDSLGGPSSKLTQFPIGGLKATCVWGVCPPQALRRASVLAHHSLLPLHWSL